MCSLQRDQTIGEADQLIQRIRSLSGHERERMRMDAEASACAFWLEFPSRLPSLTTGPSPRVKFMSVQQPTKPPAYTPRAPRAPNTHEFTLKMRRTQSAPGGDRALQAQNQQAAASPPRNSRSDLPLAWAEQSLVSPFSTACLPSEWHQPRFNFFDPSTYGRVAHRRTDNRCNNRSSLRLKRQSALQSHAERQCSSKTQVRVQSLDRLQRQRSTSRFELSHHLQQVLQYNRESGQTLLRTAATARLRTTHFCVEEPSPASANLACGTTAGVSEAADNGVLVSEAGSEAELESVRASDSSSASDDDHIFVQRGVPILQLSSVSRPLSANADSTTEPETETETSETASRSRPPYLQISSLQPPRDARSHMLARAVSDGAQRWPLSPGQRSVMPIDGSANGRLLDNRSPTHRSPRPFDSRSSPCPLSSSPRPLSSSPHVLSSSPRPDGSPSTPQKGKQAGVTVQHQKEHEDEELFEKIMENLAKMVVQEEEKASNSALARLGLAMARSPVATPRSPTAMPRSPTAALPRSSSLVPRSPVSERFLGDEAPSSTVAAAPKPMTKSSHRFADVSAATVEALHNMRERKTNETQNANETHE